MNRMFQVFAAVSLVLATGLFSHAQTSGSPPPVPFEQSLQDYKAKIDGCLAGLSKKDASREERGAAAFSVSYLLGTYELFTRDIGESHRQKLAADAELADKLCALHIAYADYLLEDARPEAAQPVVTALEKACKEFQQAGALLHSLADREAVVRHGKRIEAGLARTIAGLNKYAAWFEKDVFMNPSGKKWENNPAADAEKLRARIATVTSASGELATCENALEQTIKDMTKAAERKDGAAALENMILGARWLTTILQKSPELFLRTFRTYNDATRAAMEEARKGYAPERMREFSRFYEPLKSNYIYLASKTNQVETGKQPAPAAAQ